MRILSFFRSLVPALFLIGSLSSCEDVIDVDLDSATPQLAVDGLVMVNDGPQKIRLTITKPYFDNSGPASGASGASVRIVSSLGRVFEFTENPESPGDYLSADSLKGVTGEVFQLTIRYNGETFTSSSTLVRGTVIDTLYQEEREAEFGNEAGTYLFLNARDSVGVGDYCWIRYSLNGKRDLRPGKILVAADAAFNPGDADGLEFIYPVRNAINNEKPYLVGDQIEVELVSIDAENFRFLTEMNTQLNNTGLFAEPPANVRGNLFNANPSGKTQAVGCFGISRVSRSRVTIQ